LGGRFINGSGALRGEAENAWLELERRHCEERSDEAIHSFFARTMDCFASLAMTALQRIVLGSLKIESGICAESVMTLEKRFALSSWPGIAVRRTASLPLAYAPAIHVFLAML